MARATRDRTSIALSTLLLLGGIPPIVSGLAAMLVPGAYLDLAGDVGRLDERSYGLVLVLLGLQGGDAFARGAARVAVVVAGSARVKVLLAVPAIAHSLFEVWLLPTRLLGWCRRFPESSCSPLLRVEVWGFVGLHLVLVVGFAATLGVILARRDRSGTAAAGRPS